MHFLQTDIFWDTQLHAYTAEGIKQQNTSLLTILNMQWRGTDYERMQRYITINRCS